MNDISPYMIELLRKQSRNISILSIACIVGFFITKKQNDKINTLTKKVEELSKKGE